MNEMRRTSVIFQSQYQNIEPVRYQRGNLRGESIATTALLDMENLPWESAPKRANAPAGSTITCAKRSKTRSVLTFEISSETGPPVRIFAKRCLARHGFKRLVSLVRPSKCHREWNVGRAALRRGIPTALPMTWADLREGDRLVASFLVTLGIEGSVDFITLLRELSSSEERAFWCGRLGNFIRETHERGFAHDDLSTEHILVSAHAEAPAGEEGPSFHFIDLDQARLSNKPVSTFRRAHNFYQIFRSLTPDLFGDAERQAFYRGYSRGLWKPQHTAPFERAIKMITLQKQVFRFFKIKTWKKMFR